MTVDDTFKILKRIPHREMKIKYNNLNDITWNNMTDQEVELFFSQYGWSEYEYRAYNENKSLERPSPGV